MGKRDRDRVKEKKTPTEKTAVLRSVDRLATETLSVLCKEAIFPKRTRWIIGQPIANLVNNVHSCVMAANGIRVESHAEFTERHRLQTMAVAYLYALDVKMNLAQAVLAANADKLEFWAGLFLETDKYIKNWISSDTKRYSGRFGPLSDHEDKTPGKTGETETDITPSREGEG